MASSNIGPALGNPPFPGFTSSGGPNWVGDLIHSLSPTNPPTLSYNFAVTGAAVDHRITPNPDIDFDFVNLADLFVGSMGPEAGRSWNSENSAFVVWFGQNDLLLTWEKENYQAPIASVYDKILTSYFEQIDKLYFLGARKFILVAMESQYHTKSARAKGLVADTFTALERTPYFADSEDDVIKELVASDTRIWNAELRNRAVMFSGAHHDEGLSLQVVDIAPAFDRVLDHPKDFGAQNARCYNEDGTTCLWWDFFHPGQAIHREIAKAMYGALKTVGFYS